ncbi:unnamed protein product [Owenia fusiformis]|uniref:Uncharacterized protein n=1 Tax=Owenia fusiformis TaxID=6347 RepID=A0A8J1Y2S6_OWEFU|nr:unnamed protein product [Owenia fusiformis]
MTFWSNKRCTYGLPKKFNISVMGSRGCGKSSIVNQFMHNCRTTNQKASENIHSFNIQNGDKSISFDILDTTDSCYYPTTMRKFPIADSQAFILVYALDDPDSFDEAINIYNEICKQRKSKPGVHIPIVFVANKSDLWDEWDDEITLMNRVISQTTVEIDMEMAHLEVSARDNINVIDIFEKILQLIGCMFPLKKTIEQQRLSNIQPPKPKSKLRQILSLISKKPKDPEVSEVKINMIGIEDDLGSSVSDSSSYNCSDFSSYSSISPRKASLPSSALYKSIWASSYETIPATSSMLNINDKEDALFRKGSLDWPRCSNDLQVPRKEERRKSLDTQLTKMKQNRYRNDRLFTPLIDATNKQNSPKSSYEAIPTFDFLIKTESLSFEDEVHKMANSDLEKETETNKSLMNLCKSIQIDAVSIMQCLPRQPKHYVRYYD